MLNDCINILRMCILSKAIHRFSVIPIKIPLALIREIEQITKIDMETQKKPE